MYRYVLAAVLAAALGSRADAQYFVGPTGALPRGATAGGNLHNYDTGDFLLGGFQGLARTAGTFSMAGGTGAPNPFGIEEYGPRYKHHHFTHVAALLHHKKKCPN